MSRPAAFAVAELLKSITECSAAKYAVGGFGPDLAPVLHGVSLKAAA